MTIVDKIAIAIVILTIHHFSPGSFAITINKPVIIKTKAVGSVVGPPGNGEYKAVISSKVPLITVNPNINRMADPT